MSKLIDLTGKTFNYLYVIERDREYEKTVKNKEPYWKCKCLKCGTIKTIRSSSIRSGRTKSCGCFQKEAASKYSLKDLTNQKFGDLTVLRRDFSKESGHQKKAYWIC